MHLSNLLYSSMRSQLAIVVLLVLLASAVSYVGGRMTSYETRTVAEILRTYDYCEKSGRSIIISFDHKTFQITRIDCN